MAPRGVGALDAPQRPHLAQQTDDTHQTREFTDEMAQEGAKPGQKAAIPAPTRAWEPKTDRKYVWLDVAIDNEYVGRVTAELYADIVPKTVENFRALTTGEKGPDYAFKGSVCHRILKNFIVQCGDFTTAPHLDGKHVVFGEVVEGFEVVDKMEQAGVERDGIPLQHKVSFTDGGEILF
ncbi:hypothetical protein PC129_g7383 [Phytophthora cactorum]|uniref:Peptidyl-prolyl cis-trans isomerase n=1 Tax=Phytophthora cactorum TaxID=29920 RepID=A0A8T1IAZ2_9STRA|nr:hypothetical protein PC111_g3633 [Phytophthora cactorum]KAG2997923.1 hypothetical protein PC118_g1609 [Phytophthora cactorum]KAG3221879.1 hypothetical protein PC129_g7383 [Phytophthora cactorum]